MNLLVVLPDPNLARLMERMLGEAGHRVRVAPDARGALAMAAATPPEVLVLDEALREEPGPAWLRRLRARERADGLPPARVVLIADDPDATRLRTDGLGVEHVLGRPPSLLDLLDLVGSMGRMPTPPPTREPTQPTATIDPARDGLCLPNLARLGGWWGGSASGVMRVDLPGGTTRWVPFASGGPVGDDGLHTLVHAFYGGTLDFDPCDVDGPGDSPGLCRELWRAARAWMAGHPPDGADRLLRPLPGVGALRLLPVGERTRKALAELSRPTPASALAAEVRVPLADLLYDAHTAALLGLVSLEDVPAARARVPDPTRALPLPPPRAAAPLPPPESPFGADDGPTRAAVFATPTRAATADPPTDRTEASPALVAQQVVRLRREARLVEEAEPWTVLALPRGSSPEVVARAAERMTTRYQAYARSAHPEIRACAERILARVSAAEDAIRRDGSARVPTEEALIAAGKTQIARGDWEGADRRFSAARDLAPNSPAALAHLGWARFHNPAQEAEAREEEGVALIDLALAFDAQSADALYLRAALAQTQGDSDLARRHLLTLLQAHPDHTDGRALLARVSAA